MTVASGDYFIPRFVQRLLCVVSRATAALVDERLMDPRIAIVSMQDRVAGLGHIRMDHRVRSSDDVHLEAIDIDTVPGCDDRNPAIVVVDLRHDVSRRPDPGLSLGLECRGEQVDVEVVGVVVCFQDGGRPADQPRRSRCECPAVDEEKGAFLLQENRGMGVLVEDHERVVACSASE
ncbi:MULTISPECIES: hypothetical protein [unclassified Cryobacterium]|uniref:hypothetical protein n=1 Tax=unclassified Cryobacterium TaxID=2649013 RepID=UPI00106B672A|nr:MULTISPECIES: hypothetical protein [unclassified Cryobacterium]TFB97685.1 hypothetical protein E3O39_07700 [Cryobacterium sp. MDB2-A-1]TFC07805.1 hypothetical protein E3O35_18330 [Cryobacterium sp. MDB2-A-2]TFC11416.1 hypothetical protein E3O59_00125 [Cryobacterium sp. MDB2-33-2]TFC21037.1 hypothetical protein E3O51_04860 [Cryobacterium sp. MDB2-10]